MPSTETRTTLISAAAKANLLDASGRPDTSRTLALIAAETDEECIDELASTFGVSESVATKAYYRSYKSFVDAAAWLEQYTADPY